MKIPGNSADGIFGAKTTAFTLTLFFCGLTATFFYLLSPMIHSIFLAMILSGLFSPLCRKIAKIFKIRIEIAALLTSTLIVLSLLIPFLYFASQLTIEAFTVFEQQAEFFSAEKITSLFTEEGFVFIQLNDFLSMSGITVDKDDLISLLIENANQIAQFSVNLIQEWISNTFTYTFSVVFDFIIMILVIYGLLTQGKNLKRFMFYCLPLHPFRLKIVLKKFNQMNYVTLVVNGIGGLIQGGVAGIAFFLTGIHSVFLWTFLMIILAFIPLLGISIIYIPATVYLAFQGEYYNAIFVAVVSAVTSLVVENWYKPRFIGKKVQINSILMLLGMIGGLIQFGALGIFYGPIIITLFMSFSEFIRTEFNRMRLIGSDKSTPLIESN